MKKLKIVLPVVLMALVVVGLGIFVNMRVNADAKANETIAQNVYIGDINVGGMTAQEAEQAVEQYVSQVGNTVFTLTTGGKSVTATAAQLGLSWDNKDVVEEAKGLCTTGNLIARYKAKKDLEKEKKVYNIAYGLDKDVARNFLENSVTELEQEAVNCGLKRENGQFIITDGQDGIEVDLSASLTDLEKFFKDWDGTSDQVEITSKIVQPEGNREQLAKVKDVLGTYTTDYSSSKAGRAKNVENGAEKINGTVLYPGDTFSVYNAVSPFTAENGYELAGSYENGTTVETYGGGICQVSTTLYNAVIRAELEVNERYNHSMTVHYVDLSGDAAIAGTYKDFKFTNNTDTPIYIAGSAGGGYITFTVYGVETRPADRTVTFESETVQQIDSVTRYVADGSMPIGSTSSSGSAHTGYEAKLWKVVKVNGVEESRELFNTSTYKSTDVTVSVGVASAVPEATAAVQAAIATQDYATIQAAMAANNDAALAQAAAEAAAQPEGQQPEGESPEGQGPEGQEPVAPEEQPGDAGAPTGDNNEQPAQEEQPQGETEAQGN